MVRDVGQLRPRVAPARRCAAPWTAATPRTCGRRRTDECSSSSGSRWPDPHTQYYEVFALTELSSTLGTLRNALAIGGLLAVAIGGLLGYWMSRLVLRPGDLVRGRGRTRRDGRPHRPLGAPATIRTSSPSRISFNRMVDAGAPTDRAREPVRRRRQSRAALPAHDAVDGVPARGGAGVGAPAACRGRRSSSSTSRSAGCRSSWRICSSSGGPTPASPISPLEQVEVDGVRHEGRSRRTTSTASRSRIADDPDIEAATASAHRGAGRQAAPGARAHEPRRERRDARQRAHRGRRVTASDAMVRIAVDDDGPGIPAADRQEVFARFFRGATAGRRASSSGSGLGLGARRRTRPAPRWSRLDRGLRRRRRALRRRDPGGGAVTRRVVAGPSSASCSSPGAPRVASRNRPRSRRSDVPLRSGASPRGERSERAAGADRVALLPRRPAASPSSDGRSPAPPTPARALHELTIGPRPVRT